MHLLKHTRSETLSYCRFHNTLSALRECVYAMDEAYNLKDMDLSEDEAHAAKRLYSYAQQYVEQVERLTFADTFEDKNEEVDY